jgi:hypothetical protein
MTASNSAEKTQLSQLDISCDLGYAGSMPATETSREHQMSSTDRITPQWTRTTGQFPTYKNDLFPEYTIIKAGRKNWLIVRDGFSVHPERLRTLEVAQAAFSNLAWVKKECAKKAQPKRNSKGQFVSA